MVSNEELKTQALELLKKNRKTGYSKWAKKNFDFSCPSTRTYPYQWFWDSCFHIITLSHLDPQMAKNELKSLLSMQFENGFIPHVIFWDRGILKPKLWRYSQSAEWSLRPKTTHMIQPPVLGLTLETYAKNTNDAETIKKALPKADAYFDWLALNRDPDRDHLISIITPYESGLDYEPHFDEVVGFHPRDNDQTKLLPLETKYRKIDLRNKIHGYNSLKILELDYFNVEDVMVNVIYAESLKSMSRLHSQFNKEEKARAYQKKGEDVANNILSKCYDQESGLYFSLSGKDEKKLKTKTSVSLMPLWLDEISKGDATRLVEEHLQNKKEFWADYPVPTVSMDEPTYDALENHFIWRGPSWVNLNWFLVQGLRKHGWDDVASHIVEKTKEMVKKSGYREYFNPQTAEGYGARDFGWSTILIDML